MTNIPTLAEASRRIAAHEVSPVELVRNCLDRIAAHDGRIHAYLELRAEAALAEAKLAEAEIMAGRRRGPLHGIPIGLKDIIETAGLRTTGGSRLRQDYVPVTSATLHRNLAAAGAILLGKHTTHEFALGGPSFDLPAPPARNPWDTARFTGGSSSGSGAAIAAGFCLGAVGTDTSGSIRMPAALCGTAGLKPSQGRVSLSGVFPLSPLQDHAGPLAWTSEDCALMLGGMAGYDPADPMSVDAPVPDFAAALGGDLKGVRVGISRRWHETDMPVDADTRAAIDAAAAVLRDLGAEVEEAAVPPLDPFQAAGMAIVLYEAYGVYGPDLLARAGDFGKLFRDRVLLGGLIDPADYAGALRLRQEVTLWMDTLLQRHDVLLTGTFRTSAPLLAEVAPFYFMATPNTMPPANLAGLPALSVCTGFTPGGLPLAMQLIGRRFDEAGLLRVGDAYERATPWRSRRPF